MSGVPFGIAAWDTRIPGGGEHVMRDNTRVDLGLRVVQGGGERVGFIATRSRVGLCLDLLYNTTVNKNVAEDSTWKTFYPEFIKTINFDRFNQGVSLQYVFQIPLPNYEFGLCNRQRLGCMFCIYLAHLNFYVWTEKYLSKDVYT